MTEHERRLAAAEKALGYHIASHRDITAAAIDAYTAPLPPEPQMVTDEMVKVARYAYNNAMYHGNERAVDRMTLAIEAAMRASPVIKAAQRAVATTAALMTALDDAGL
jgi:hypothetical protein